MIVSVEKALKIYSSLEARWQIPCFDPRYVLADAHRDKGLMPIFFVHEDDGDIFYYPFHLVQIPETKYFEVLSAYGYGGPVCTSEKQSFLKSSWAAYEEWCREQNVIDEFVRFHPLALNHEVYAAPAIYNRKTVWVDLTAGVKDSYLQRVRTAIRKAEKCLEIEVTEDGERIEGFFQTYTKGMELIGASPFYFFNKEYFNALAQWPERYFVFAKHEGQTVGAAMFLRSSATIEYHLSGLTSVGRRLSASNLILHAAIGHAVKTGAQRLHLGGGTNSSPDNPLLFFKSGFSDLRSAFHIGHRVFDQSAYDQVKLLWTEKNGPPGTKLYFCR